MARVLIIFQIIFSALVLLAAGIVPSFAQDDVPIGRERVSGGIGGDIFERKGGYVHPFLSLTEYYTDNVFNVPDNETDDFVTVISPGIWVAVPRMKERLVEIETSTVSPGGAALSRFFQRQPGRYQAYAFYRADLERYARHSSENTDNHRAEATLQYNFRGGLSIDLLGQFIKSHNPRGTGPDIADLDEYDAFYASPILSYQISDTMLVRVDYSNYTINYTSEGDDFRDRADNSVSGYLFYKIRPRTALFFQYEFIDINYDQSVLSDSRQHHLFLGARKEVTAKTTLMLKAGYGIKDFESNAVDNRSTFLFETQVQHNFTPKTSVSLVGSRRTTETDIAATDYVLTHSVGIQYLQKVTGKITGSVLLTFADERYKGASVTVGGETKRRKDHYYGVGPGIQYRFKEWLSADLRYTFSKRDSNLAAFDYTNNTVALRLTGSF